MKILIVEDKKEELAKAIEAGEKFGHEIIPFNPAESGYRWINLLSEADGVITDLMFKPAGARCKEIPPAGLVVTIHALSIGKPVVICTDEAEKDKSWGHHGEAIGWLYDGYISKIDEPPFGFVETKNWKWAFELLDEQLKEK